MSGQQQALAFPDRRSGDWVTRMQHGREMWDRFNGAAIRWWMARTGGRRPELVVTEAP